MKNQANLYLMMQEDDHNIFPREEDVQSSYDNKKSKYQQSSYYSSFTAKSSSKQHRTLSKRNQNEQLQDLLQTQTINYGNLSNLSGQKKRLFPDLSFFSKDCTQDHSNYEGYSQIMNKIHFQKSRSNQLNEELARLKENLTQKYLSELMEEFNELSQENQQLRKVYKKQAGGGYRQKMMKANSTKPEQLQKINQPIVQFYPETPTARNSTKTGRKSLNGGSVAGSQQPFSNKYNSFKPNGIKQKSFFGVGNQNFCQTQKMQTMLRQANKMQYCQSSIDIHAGQSLVPSPKKHKRRQSQLTERKDYPGKENTGNDFLMILDDGSELSFDNEVTGRMSQPGKMPKRQCAKQVDERMMLKDSGHWGNGMSNYQGKNNFGDTIQRNSMKLQINQAEQYPLPTTTKNIFLQFLQTLLIEERAAFSQITQEITETTLQVEQKFVVPSYNSNIKPIQKLEKQIMTKNFKLRQLQEVINVFKGEIQHIMGTDIKIIDQLMEQLLQVKGKYLQMQQKVNGITGLKKELQSKQKLKQDILATIKQKIQKRKKQSQQKQQPLPQSENQQLFPIPQSIKTLFDLLNIIMPKNSKPIDYLKEVKQLPNNKELFQAFDSKKRASCNMKIKQVIDMIRQGRKKFNEVIKIYQGRIVKLQQKIQRYKNEKHHHTEQK